MRNIIQIRSHLRAAGVALAITLCTAAAGQATQKLKVVVSIAPIHALAAGVMEGVGEPVLLLPGGASPHSYSLKPSQARALNNARIVVRVSDQMESFLVRPLENLTGKVEIVTLTQVDGMIVYESRESGLWDGNAERIAGEMTQKEHGPAHKSHDPHIWLDPRNAKRIVSALAITLRKTYPGHAEAFAANAKKLTAKLDKLDRDLLIWTKPLRGKPYILFHDATRYFDTRYKLNAAGAITISPERPPGARRLSEIRRYIKAQKITCVFTEPQFRPKLVQTLISGTGARIASLDPIGTEIPAGPELYFKLMRNLAASMAACLKNS